MTRLNLVPVQELADQHLFSEFREIKMVPKSLARSLKARGLPGVLGMIPPTYRLGAGHVSFFYNKGAYLVRRYAELRAELELRGVKYNRDAQLDPDKVFAGHPCLQHEYTPTPEALALIRGRIAERVAARLSWYRYTRLAA